MGYSPCSLKSRAQLKRLSMHTYTLASIVEQNELALYIWASLVAQIVKNLPAMQETWVQSLRRSPGVWHGNPLQYSCLENPHGQRSLAGLQSMGSQRVRHD